MFKDNKLENKVGFFGGFIAVLAGSIGLLLRDNDKIKSHRIILIIASAIVTLIGFVSMFFSLDKSLKPIEEKEDNMGEDEDWPIDEEID